MRFNKQNKVIIKTLDRDEAKAFIAFLDDERNRHRRALWQSERSLKSMVACGKFWQTAGKRHQQDIADIDALIEKVGRLKL